MNVMSTSKWHAVFGHTRGLYGWMHANGGDEHLRRAQPRCIVAAVKLPLLSAPASQGA